MIRLALVLAALSLTGCVQDLGWAAVERMIAAEYPDTPTISADSLAARLGDAPPLLLDVRTPEEFAVSHLAGARRVDPAGDALPPEIGALDRDTPIVAYCSVGWRSAALVQQLRAAGFTDVANLRGSIFRWANEGRPVVRGDSAVREVHPYDRRWGRLLDAELRAFEPGSASM